MYSHAAISTNVCFCSSLRVSKLQVLPYFCLPTQSVPHLPLLGQRQLVCGSSQFSLGCIQPCLPLLHVMQAILSLLCSCLHKERQGQAPAPGKTAGAQDLHNPGQCRVSHAPLLFAPGLLPPTCSAASCSFVLCIMSCANFTLNAQDYGAACNRGICVWTNQLMGEGSP